ncbi:MAG TPA: 16S rRNA (adenine(1518)-N(6)/adenine(1519)-N(6))-dimethyltransferase RsmA [Dissulfurispiraceae bacterium]|nr:16S rRNA (adenine(1518)-N(6)/adenine(1519)-N(6))-dimethyltransferase RsmA [Dissulfurispiraceae bacterium]
MLKPKKALGQNYLFNPILLTRILDAAEITREDLIVEIGPGPGRMTESLAQRAQQVIAIELDAELYARLRQELAGYFNLELVHMDALDYPFESLPPFKVVANIPYYITTPIIFRLLEARTRLRSMTLTIQKEVAERIVAPPGGKDYGVLSLAVQYRAVPSLCFTVAREEFRPVPKVDSAVLRMDMRVKPPVEVSDEKMLFRVIKTAFAQRRKTLSNALKPLVPESRDILLKAGIDPQRRAETLSIEDFARIANLLS